MNVIISQEISPFITITHIGDSIQLACYSKTVPKWRRNETELFEYTVVTEHTGSKEIIQIDDLQITDSNTYNCYGRSEMPFRASAKIYVGGKAIYLC